VARKVWLQVVEGSPTFNHAEYVSPGERVIGEASALIHTAEEGRLLISLDPCSFNISVHVDLSIVVRWHLVALAAFLMQSKPPPLAVLVVVLDPQHFSAESFFINSASVISPFSINNFARASVCARVETINSCNETVPSLSSLAIVPPLSLQQFRA